MGICNKIAGILAPLLIGTLVLHGIGDLSAQVADADPDQGRLLDRFAAKIHAPTWRWPASCWCWPSACCSRRCRS
jgi:fucose permease